MRLDVYFSNGQRHSYLTDEAEDILDHYYDLHNKSEFARPSNIIVFDSETDEAKPQSVRTILDLNSVESMSVYKDIV